MSTPVRSFWTDLHHSCRYDKDNHNRLDEFVSTPVRSILDGSSSFLQITRTTITDWMSLNFG